MKPGVRPAVSRETSARLDIYVRELRRWQPAINLVASSSLEDVWFRHIEDCLQLVDIEPGARSWLDLGSGGGLPGLIIAAHDAAPAVAMIESDGRKCAFLRSTARAMGVDATVHEGRIEAVLPTILGIPAVVTARALAPLTRLLDYAQPLLAAGAVGLFPRGRSFDADLTLARESWRFEHDVILSRTDSDGRILRIRRFEGPRSRDG